METPEPVEEKKAETSVVAAPKNASAASFRHGQWVKFAFKAGIPGAHETKDKLYVGIYHRAGKDATGAFQPEVVFVQKQDSNENLSIDGHAAFLFPGQCENLRAVTSRSDIPAARLATMKEDWVPEA